MLIADDQRRFVDTNQAACLFLRLPRDRILGRAIDELTPPELRGEVDALWEEFLRMGTQTGIYELQLPTVHERESNTAPWPTSSPAAISRS